MKTAVGRRLIAFYTIINNGNAARLRDYIADNFDEAALAQQSVDERLHWHQDFHAKTGKIRVVQVIGMDDHRMVLVVQGQNAKRLYLDQVAVSPEYPHKILAYHRQALD